MIRYGHQDCWLTVIKEGLGIASHLEFCPLWRSIQVTPQMDVAVLLRLANDA